MQPIKKFIAAIAACGACALATSSANADVYDEAFTFNYQGVLQSDGGTYDTGTAEITFQVFDAAVGGQPHSEVAHYPAVPIDPTTGLFSVDVTLEPHWHSPLPLRRPFDGNARWLEIVINGEVLQPRQQVHAAPMASVIETSHQIWKHEVVAPSLRVRTDPDVLGVGIGMTPRSGFELDVAGELGADTIYVDELNATTADINHLVVNGQAYPPGATILDVQGRVRSHSFEITGGSDLAEPFDIRGAVEPEPGMVVCIDPERIGAMRISDAPRDRTVAGIISGANGVRPGITLTQEGTVADGDLVVALAGRVWCWVDAAEGGAVAPGDLLTTSATPGHAMRAESSETANGAIIGKAMSSLDEGRGLVLVLVNLQ